jgi:HD-GYP domain-containing protein (c-di-GMP phosphodiesterase class II)
VRSTHERFDGSGYPDGLAGEDIPLGARIIAACDAYAAMTSPRPYATQKTRVQALEELLRYAGTQFDPQVVAVLRQILTDQPDIARNVPASSRPSGS